jgi:hypothetical protein
MYSWVSTEFHRHGIPLIQHSVDTEFRRQRNSIDTEFPHWHGIPLLTLNSPVDTEFPRGHGIPPSTLNSPVDSEFCRHGILSTRNSADTEFCRHGIPSTRNSINTEFHQHGIPPTRNYAYFFTSVYSVCYAMLCYLFTFQL